MSVLDTLVFDRTAADVERWRTLREKGYDGMTADERAKPPLIHCYTLQYWRV